MKIDRKRVSIELNRDEVMLLNGALNEVCNGVAIGEEEFATRLGANRAEARRLLQRMHKLWDDMRASGA